jgi:hypothetical protein
VPDDHKSSAKSLERAGFTKAAEEPYAGFVRFELKRSNSADSYMTIED